MAKLKTERIIVRDDGKFGGENIALDFSIDINVSQDGNFTTYFPADICKTLSDAGIEMNSNGRRNGRIGYVEAPSMPELMQLVKNKAGEYVSKALIEEMIVIRYRIDTACCYMIEDSQFLPNGMFIKDEKNNQKWIHGTKNSSGSFGAEFGFNMWTEPCYKRTFKYRSGKTKTLYDAIRDTEFEDKPMLNWLTGIKGNKFSEPEPPMEIEYTEDTAAFFVNAYKALFQINERIKNYVKPEAILSLIENRQKLFN